jgi:hypothetical protein
LDDPLPLTGALERAFTARVSRLDAKVQAVLLLAAAEGTGRLAAVRRAGERLGLDSGALGFDRLADLVRVEGSTLAFRHPLVRSAVYHGASAAARMAAHRALAEALDEREGMRRAWHRAQATDGPEEAVARELELAAQLTLGRAGCAAAAAALERAAELSVTGEDRARRLAAAAAAAWRGGDTGGACALLDRAERLDDPVLLGLAGQLAWRVGGDEPARTLHARAVARARCWAMWARWPGRWKASAWPS